MIKFFFNEFAWETVNKKILLTFDDGPLPESTSIILKALDEQKIKALFFCVGDNAEKNPGLISEIIKGGHDIGCHMLHHEVITNLGSGEVKNQIEKFGLHMKEKHNYEVKYFRPPHGRFNLTTKKILNEVNLKNVMWSLLTYDYKNDLELVKFAVTKYLRNNSIVVLHDSIKSKSIIADSIKFILDQADKNGFLFGAPQECLK